MRSFPRSSRGIRSKKFAGLKPRSASVDRTNPRLEALEDRTLMACLDRPSLHLPDLSLGSFDLQPPSLPDLNVALRGINLGDINIGIDTYAIDLKAALGKIDVTLGNLPVIGAQLPKVTLPAIKMLDLMRVNLDVALEGLFGDINLPKIDVSAQLPSLLFDVFGPQGLNLLKDGPDAGNGISRSDVYTSHGSDWEQFDMHLGQSYYVDLPLDLGLSGADSPLAQYMPNFDLALAANNGIRVQFQWDLYLGMGFTTHLGPEGTGFYFNSGARDNITGDALPELSASINVSAAPPKDAAGRDIPSNAPGLSASATMGLFQGSVTDGTARSVQLTSRYPMYTNCPTNAYNANFNLIVSTKNEGTITVPVVFNDTNFVSFLADLNTKVNQGLAGKFPSANPLPISITPQFMAGKDPSSTIEATLRILSREPEITGLQIVGASDLGFVDDQYEDGRSQSLGFTDGATSVASGVNQVLTAALPAPSAGYLSEDADFKLLINGTIVPVVIREASTEKHIAGLAPSAGYFSDQTSLQETLLASLQNALSQSGFDPSKVQVSLDSSGRKFVITALPGLVPGQSAAPTLVAKVATVDKTQFSISTSVDLKSPSYDASKPGSLDRLYFTQLAQAKRNKTLSQIVLPQTRADGAIRLHTSLGFAGQDLGIAGGSLSGPSVAFDLVWDVSATASYDLGTRKGSKTSQIGNVYFNNVQLDAGGVIQGILKPVAGVLGTITGPLSKVAGAGSAVLNKPIPFISDLFGSTTLLSALQSLSGADLSSLNTLFGFFDGLGSFPSAVASIPTDKPIGLGDWEFVTDKQNPLVGKLVPSEIGAVVDSGKSLPLSTFMTLLPQKPGFHLDLLDPTNIANILLGKSFRIMSYGMPSAFNLNISPGFSASGSVDLGIGTVSFSVGAHLGIGINLQPLELVYDSTGLEEAVAQARAGRIPDPMTLLDGVYLTVPQGNAISVSGSFSASGSISAVDVFDDNIGSVSISAGLGMGAYVQIFDPIGYDDKLRLNEIFAATNNFSDPAGIFSLFNIGANLSGYLNFSGSIAGISIDDILDAIGIPTSYSISAGLSTNDIFGSTRSPAPQPLQLATPTTRNGRQVLEVNAGPLASRRKSGNVDDSKGFHLKVTGNSSSITVINSDLNQQSTYTGNFSKVVIQGGSGADDIDCSGLVGVSAEIQGGGGNDVIRGGSGSDVIDTGDGDVTVFGGAGNDVITGGAGTDTIVLGNGNNSVTAGTGRLVLTDGNGNNTIDASASLSPFVFTTGSGSDRIIGSNNNDTIVATGSGNVFIQTGAGNSTITGNAGAGTILLGDGDNTVNSGSGNQTIVCGRGDNTIRLGGGNNSVTAGGGTMKITDGTGTNTIDFRGNAEAISSANFVATGNDTIYGTNFGDTVTTSGTGRITFLGGVGNDVINGGSGDDVIYLGPGNNRVDTGGGNNSVIENRGNNYIDFSKSDADVTFTTAGGNDTVIGSSLHDNILIATGVGRTTLVGGKARNTLKGNAGNDTFIGKFGDTILEGSGVNTFVIDGTAGVGLTIGATQASQGTNSINFRPGETLTVTLGDRDESIDINGFNGKLSVSAGNGRNTLTARNLTGNATITAGTGDDRLTVNGVTGSLTLNPGLGANTLDVSNVSGTLSFNETGSDNVTINNTQGTLTYVGTGSNVVNATNIRGTKSFTTGASADSITITNDPGTLTLSVGDGNDNVTLTGIAGTVSITGGAGNKTIAETNIVGDSTINLGNGSSSVTFTNVNGNISTTTSVGATSVSLTNTSGSKVTISTASGDDTISLTQVTSGQVTINDSGSSSSVGNRVTIGTSAAPVSITAGTGKNTVGVNGLTGTLGITASDGDLGVTGSGISGHVRIDANNTIQGLGNDSIVLSQLGSGLEIRSGVGTNSTTLSNIAGGLSLTTRTGTGLSDTISITNLSGGATITTGSGPDSISLNGISGTLSVDTGLGGNVAPSAGQTLAVGDTITASGIASQATFTVRSTAGVSPILNSVVLSDSSGPVTINGFENNGDVTSATLNRNSGNVTLTLNSGNDVLTVNGGIGGVTYSSGDGDNTVAINSLAGPGSITLGGGRNVVRTFGNAGALSVKGGRLSPTSPFDTSLIVDRSSVVTPLVGAIGTSVVGGTTLPTVTGLGLGAVSYQNVKVVEIDLGSSPDQFTFNDAGSTIPIVLNEGGGDDQTTVNALSSTTTVNGGSGNDTVIAEIPGDPSLSSFSRLQLNVDNLIVDNSSYASPVNWVYNTPSLIVGSTTVVTTTGASNVNLLGGTSGGNKLTINSLANSAQQLNITRSNIRLLAGANVLSPNASTPFVPGYQYGGGLGAVESLGTGPSGQQLELLATAQKPSISQIGPVTISSGFTDANLLIIGGNFRPTSQVVLSANNVSTTLAFTYLSNGLLNAIVPASLRGTGGTYSVSVINPGGTASNTQTLTIDAPFFHGSGLGTSNNVLAQGAVDPHWTISGLGYSTAYAGRFGAWTATDPNANWITPNADPGAIVPVGSMTFTTTFNLTGYDPSTASLTGQVAVDNVITDIKLNGISLGLAPINNANPSYSATVPFSIGSGFIQGVNTLSITIRNDGSQAGLLAAITASAQRTTRTIPGSGFLNATMPAFGSQTYTSTNSQVSGLASADLNGDGLSDLAYVYGGSPSPGSTPGLGVLLGDGLGGFTETFVAISSVSVGTLKSVAVADLNADGKLDLFVLGTKGYQVYKGNGDGTFTALSAASTSTSNQLSQSRVILADFTGDGKMDAAISSDSSLGSSANLIILAGKGDGTFQKAVFNSLGSTNSSGFANIFTLDLNGDGNKDVLGFNQSGVKWLANLGNGNFDSPVALPLGSAIDGLALTDLDGDGLADIATLSGGTVSIYRGTGLAAFQRTSTVTIGAGTSFLGVGDLNGDGLPDLFCNDPTSTSVVRTITNAGTGIFTLGPTISNIAGGFSRVIAADLDGNQSPDLVAIDGLKEVSTVLNQFGFEGTIAAVTPPPPSASRSVLGVSRPTNLSILTTADVNSDGFDDLISIASNAPQFQVSLGNGNGTFGTPTTYSITSGPTSIKADDVDGDGKPDLLLTRSTGIGVLLNNGSGGFGAETTITASTSGFKLVAGDVTGDGILDLVEVKVTGTQIFIHPGIGNGTFSSTVTTLTMPTYVVNGTTKTATIQDAVVADLNRDGRPDLAVMANAGLVVEMALFAGTTGGVATTSAVYPLTSFLPSVDSFSVGNLDGDAIPDIVFKDLGTNSTTFTTVLDPFATPTADWSKSHVTNVNRSSNSAAPIIADFDLDGKPDVITTFGANFGVLLGDGAGSLASPSLYQTLDGKSVTSLTVSDLNEDGFLDLVGGESAGSNFHEVLSSRPLITALTPSAAFTEGPGFTLTVDGTGLDSGTTVYWNGQVLKKVNPGSSKLIMTVPAELLQGVGNIPVWVRTGAGAVSPSITVPVSEPVIQPSPAAVLNFVQNVNLNQVGLATFTSSAGDTILSAMSARVDWGDGTSSLGTIAKLGSGSYAIQGNHSYSATGTYTVKITTTYPYDSNLTRTVTTTASVVAQTLSVQSPAFSVNANTAYSGLIATFTDNNTTLDSSAYSAVIDWGDGITGAGFVFGSLGSFSVAGTHVYTSPGNRAATVRITQASRTATSASTVSVLPSVGLIPDTLAIIPTTTANSIVSSGSPTFVSLSTPNYPAPPRFAALSPDGRHLLVIDTANTLRISAIGTSGVTPTATLNVPGDATLAMSPDGGNLYLLSASGLSILRYVFTNGVLSNSPTLIPIANASVIGFSSDSGTAYVANTSGGLTVCSVSNGILTPIQTLAQDVNGIDGLASTSKIVVSDDGASVYIGSSSLGTLASFNRDKVTGRLTFAGVARNGVFGVSGLTGIAGIASTTVTPSSGTPVEYVFAVGTGDSSVSVFNRDQNGAVVFLQRLSQGAGGIDGLAAPNSLRVLGTQLEITSFGDDANWGGVALFDISQIQPAPVLYNTTFSGLNSAEANLGNGGNIVSLTSAKLASFTLNADAGDDQVTINGTNASSATTIKLGGGTNVVGLVSEGVQSSVTITAAGSTKNNIFNIASTATGATNTISGGDGSDTFNVDGAQLLSNLTINGGLPTVAPGDVLNFSSGGLSISPAQPTLPNGSVVVNPSGGVTRGTVNFTGIDKFNPIAASPIADPGGPYTINQGDSLVLSATNSNVPVLPGFFEWSFDGGPFGAVQGVSPNALSWSRLISLGLASAGSHLVSVRVTDNGYTSVATTTLTVNAVAPTLSVVGSGNAVALTPYQLSLSASELDPNNDVRSWNVQWGDGSTDTYVGSSAIVAHAYALKGSYSIRVTATDANLTTPVVTKSVNVDYNTLSMSGAESISEGTPYSLTLTDLGINLGSWTIQWGDGQTTTISAAAGGSLGTTVSSSHTFTKPGSFTIKATAQDLQGAVYSVAPLVGVKVAVAQVPPSVSIQGGSDAIEGRPYTLNLSAIEPPGISAAINGWVIHWGDAKSDTISSNPSSWTHIYSEEGTYLITASASDADGTYTVGPIVVSVSDTAATLTIAGPANIDRGRTYTLALNPTLGSDAIDSTTIFWGDGSSDVLSGAATSATHVFGSPGTYTVSAYLLTDDGSVEAANTIDVTAETVAPTLSIQGNGSVVQNDLYVLNLNAIQGSDAVTGWTINWGDGTSDVIAGDASTATHRFSNEGNIRITASASTALSTYQAASAVFVAVTDVAPVASISGAATVVQGESYSLTLQSSTGSDPITGWTVNWGDGTVDRLPATALTAVHAFSVPGSAVISAAVETEDGVFGAAGGLTVAVTPAAPLPLISGASSADQGDTYTLDLSAVLPVGDTLSRWSINWGDGTADTVLSGSAQTAVHTYLSANQTFSIVATAVKTDGAQGQATQSVFVNRVPPSVSVSGNASVAASLPYTLNLSAIQIGADPGSRISGWTINWGDGSIETLTGNPSSITHIYRHAGPYSVNSDTGVITPTTTAVITATAFEGAVGYSAAPLTVGLLGLPPVFSFQGSKSAEENRPYTLDFSAAVASGVASKIDRITIDWGDGSTSVFPASSTSATHTYTDEGTYQVLWSVSDDDGNTASGKAPLVVVNDVTAQLVLSGATSVGRNTTYVLALGLTAGSDPVLSTTVNWGDGVTEVLTGSPSTATHVYTGPGTYAVSAFVTDDDGDTDASNTLSVTAITAPPQVAIKGDSSVDEDATYTLNLSAVAGSDPILGWTIQWGDGRTEEVTGNPKTLPHVFTQVGTAVIRASVTTALGSYAAPDAIGVTVKDVAPTATLVAPSTVNLNESFQVSLVNPSDPSAADTAAGFRYLFAVDGPIAAGLGYADASTNPTKTLAFTTVGSHVVTARIIDQNGGFTDYSATISAISRATAITTTAPRVTYGQAGIVTVTVTSPGGIPNGSVSLSVDGGSALIAALDSSGKAVFTLSGLNATTHAFTATYAAQGAFLGSSGTGTLVVDRATATINVVPYHVIHDGAAHTATGIAKGVGGADLTGGLSLVGTTHVAAGTYNDSWSFIDVSGNYNTATGSIIDTIDRALTATTITSSANPLVPGQAVTFTAIVSNISTAVVPTGAVQFVVDGVNQGSPVALDGSGRAAITISNLAGGSHQILAKEINGDGNFADSVGTFTQIVSGLSSGSAYILNAAMSGAVTASGNASISFPGGLHVDSNSPTAIIASGNAMINNRGIVEVVGGVYRTGNAVVMKTGTPAFTTDPLSYLTAPALTGLTNFGSAVIGGNTSRTLSPGIYSSIQLSGNANVRLNPGTYILMGGGLQVTGNASVSGDGVFIFNAGSAYNGVTDGGNFGGISLAGNGGFNLTPSTSGPYAGILIYQSRANTRALSITGNAYANPHGTIYARNAMLSLSGNGRLDDTVVVDSLNLTGNAAVTQVAAGGVLTEEIGGSPNTLLGGDLFVYIADTNGFLSRDMLDRIRDAESRFNTLLLPHGVAIHEVDDPAFANLILDTADATVTGSAADGVLGCYNPSTSRAEITLLRGWNWYAGADPDQIGRDQYDFETTVLHEFGHALGLGHSQSSNSPMAPSLSPGTSHRSPSESDLNIPDHDGLIEPQMAAGFLDQDGESAVAAESASSASGLDFGPISVDPIDSRRPLSVQTSADSTPKPTLAWGPSRSGRQVPARAGFSGKVHPNAARLVQAKVGLSSVETRPTGESSVEIDPSAVDLLLQAIGNDRPRPARMLLKLQG